MLLLTGLALLLLGWRVWEMLPMRNTAHDNVVAPEGEVPVLDSFSPSGVAAAILRRELEMCLSEYIQARDIEIATRHQSSRVLLESRAGPGGLNDVPGGGGESTRVTPEMLAVLKRIGALDETVGRLRQDLDSSLLAVLCGSNESNRFLDCYFRHLEEAPNGQVVAWADYALQCSIQCGRSEELANAVEHVTRFHPEAKGAPGLNQAMRGWVKTDFGGGRFPTQ